MKVSTIRTIPALLAMLLAALPGQTPSAADAVAALKEREAKVRSVFQRVSPAVVALLSQDPRQMGSGSGVIVNAEGLILTAGHVTEATGNDLFVQLADGRKMRGKALGATMNRDAAMVRLLPEKDEKFPYVEVAPSDTVNVGDWCLAMGHPGGYDALRPAPLRLGKVLQKQSKHLLVSDCTLAGGDSGGPLFDLEGRLIGIHSSISGSLSHNMHVAIHVFHQDWKRLEEGDKWGKLKSLFSEPLPGYEDKLDSGGSRAVLGAKLDKRSQDGVLAREVIAGSPAQKGGMKPGDVIVKYQGQEVKDYPDLHAKLAGAEPGMRVKMTVNRKGEMIELEIELGDRGELNKGAQP